MYTVRYVCHKCNYVAEFYSIREMHPCPICSQEMRYLGHNTVVKGKLYDAFIPSGETELKIPEGVEYLEEGAYKHNWYLNNVVFPSTIMSIPEKCFEKCESLKKIEIPGSVKKIGKNAFYGCSSLESVTLLEGVVEIDECAFYSCDKLNNISFPESLKKIGKDAFSRYGYRRPQFRTIALPGQLTQIGENAFGNVVAPDIIFFVPQNSFASEYVKNNKYNYRECDIRIGFACSEGVRDGILYVSNVSSTSIKIEPGIKTIAEGAFANHAEIKEIEFPDSLIEIKAFAFKGCKSIEKISFKNGLKIVGAKAFCDANLEQVELPDTIEYLAPDAFKKSCMVTSVSGKMPGYAAKCAELADKQGKITEDKNELNLLLKKISSIESEIVTYESKKPEEILEIPTMQKNLDEIKSRIGQVRSKKDSKIKACEDQLTQIRKSIEQLSSYRNNCSLFAFSQKKELDAQIKAEKDKEMAVQENVEQIETDFSKVLSRLGLEHKVAGENLLRLETIKKPWESERQHLIMQLNELNTQRKELVQSIKESEENINKEKIKNETKEKQWETGFKREKERKRLKELEMERKKLVSSLSLPKMISNQIKYGYEQSSADEILINDAYRQSVDNKNKRLQIIQQNEYIDANVNIIARIKEINQLLNAEPDYMIESFVKLGEPEVCLNPLPERFLKLNEYFEENESWKRLEYAAKGLSDTKKPKVNIYDDFFSGADYFSFSEKDIAILLFPYCIVAFRANKQITVFTYDQIRIKRNFYSIVFAQGSRKLIELYANQYKADKLRTAYDKYCSELLFGDRKDVYNCVIAGKDISEIEAEIIRAIEKEKERQRIEKLNAEKAREQARVKALETEREKLISKLSLPKIISSHITYDYGQSSVDETAINDAYRKAVLNRDEWQQAIRQNNYIDANATTIAKIKEINQSLNVAIDSMIEKYVKVDVPDIVSDSLPERFLKLNEYFKKTETWKELKTFAKGISDMKKPKKNVYDGFFNGTDYLSFSGNDGITLLFPYCVVMYRADSQMRVYTYKQLKTKTDYKEREEVIEDIPKFGELISQKYTYINVDGSPSKRYRSNPIIKTIRYSRVIFTYDRKKLIDFPVSQNKAATELSAAIDKHRSELMSGTKKDVYESAIAGKDISEIEEKILRVTEKEKEIKLNKIKEAKAEEKRIKEERLAVEAAAEQKRLELIKRQRELNEERKRQAEEQKLKTKKIEELFKDDFADESVPSSSLNEDTNGFADSPIEVAGKKIITNTVFKVPLIALGSIENGLTVCFVDNFGTIISNKKKLTLDSQSDKTVLGFVLNAGIDYTAMKKCFMQIEREKEIIGRLEFSMNVSFSPDAF